MRVKLKLCAHAVRPEPRVNPPHTAAELATHMGHSVATDMVNRNNQAVYGSVDVAIPKGETIFR